MSKIRPKINTALRNDIIYVPKIIRECSGIIIHGRRIKSIIFTTDIAIIINNNADAILAVYPFSPHPAILKSIIQVASNPVFAGVGGGTTKGYRSAQIAAHAEAEGATAVVLNGPAPASTIDLVNLSVDCPIISTVVSEYTDIQERLDAGTDIINVSGAQNTAHIVRRIREQFPEVPIIATGGPTEETILEVIQAGANAISYTPPSNGELFRRKMDKYRELAEQEFMDQHDGLNLEEYEELISEEE